MGSNFILLYLGWEGVGLASLPAHRLLLSAGPRAVAAAKKAFITNRVGDLRPGDRHVPHLPVLRECRFFARSRSASRQSRVYGQPDPVGVPYCLMLGAFGKSAQFPLHVWLPDAMEGPTPVSAA